MEKRIKKNKKIDSILLTFILIIIAFGIIMVYSSSWPYSESIGGSSTSYLKRHLVFVVAGFIAMILFSNINYNIHKKFAVLYYVLSWIASWLVLSPIGTDRGTFARRWIQIKSITIMPSDLLKIGIIFLFAYILSSKFSKKNIKRIPFTFGILALIVFSVLPVMAQPDLSTTIAIILTCMGLFFIAGLNLMHIIPIGLFGFGGLYYVINDTKHPERIQRWLIFLNPLDDFYGKGWQLSRSLFAVSSGGVMGLGIGKSIQKHNYLSEAHNDFIFAIIAEELGFIGCLLVILAFSIIVVRGIKIALNAENDFGKYLGLGIVFLIGIQVLINICVVIGLIPPTGIGLPFISYGGSSIVCFMTLVGILLNISKRQKRR